jgi:lysine-specific histone demethylase 1B
MDFKELSRPVWGGKLGFAGEHTEMEHRGSVAGAVVSGQREAARVGRLLDLAA